MRLEKIDFIGKEQIQNQPGRLYRMFDSVTVEVILNGQDMDSLTGDMKTIKNMVNYLRAPQGTIKIVDYTRGYNKGDTIRVSKEDMNAIENTTIPEHLFPDPNGVKLSSVFVVNSADLSIPLTGDASPVRPRVTITGQVLDFGQSLG